jgi:MerR family mercuric resistance operon transcriptional regulator
MTRSDWDIGKVSAATGISPAAIRFYESEGLLERPGRSAGGRRQFDATHVQALRMIKAMRESGMSLDDIRAFKSLQRRPGATCQSLARIAADRAHAIAQKIEVLRQAENRLKGFAAACSADCAERPAGRCRTEKLLTC